MLKAKKNKAFETLFALYNRNLLKRRFTSFQISGLNFLLNKNNTLPLIIYCNHSSWWDGLAAFQISYNAGLESFILMEEKNLKRFFLFRKLGAFSVDRDNPRSASESLKYAVRLINENPLRTLWIFPQGEILPNDLRPIRFYRGLAKILENTGDCFVTSLSFRYEFLGEFKPRIFVRITEPQRFTKNSVFNSKNQTDIFARNMAENLDRLKNDIIENQLSEYVSLF